jgi:hypothetical protein
MMPDGDTAAHLRKQVGGLFFGTRPHGAGAKSIGLPVLRLNFTTAGLAPRSWYQRINLKMQGSADGDRKTRILKTREGVIVRQWIFLESELRLRNAALDVEIWLDRSALVHAPVDRLPAVSGTYRAGTIEIAFEIERCHLMSGSHSSGPLSTVWWCIDLNDARIGRRSVAQTPGLDWHRVERGLGEGLHEFVLQMPPNGAMNMVHLVGGFVHGMWSADRFCSLGNSRWYPYTRQHNRSWVAPTDVPLSLASPEWRFEERDRPKMIHAPSGDALIHEAGEPDLTPVNSYGSHVFRYEGALGTHRLPVQFRLIYPMPMPRTMPRVWEVKYHSASKRLGSPGDRTHPATAGEAPLPEAQWREFDRFVSEALLHWPADPATGAPPAWIETIGDYHGGLWSGLLYRVIGLNTRITGLPADA